MIRDRLLDRRRLEFPAFVIRDQMLDRRTVEFPAFDHGGELGMPPGFCSRIGGLLPMAPCGRSSL